MFDFKKIRKELHKNPELSDYEKKTSSIIRKNLEFYKPDEIITGIAGYGIIAVFDSGRPGPSILLRAELDGLPIYEENDFLYMSKNLGVSHSCGHDGHMSILLGVAEKLNVEKKNFYGKIYLLFQPSEENAKGAKRVLEDPNVKFIHFDYVFGLHNLPGFKKGAIILRRDIFAASSKGLIIKLKGSSSHAGHPENGNNPIFAMIDIIRGLSDISEEFNSLRNKDLITIIHVKLGGVSFGTSPGDGIVMATFRSIDEKIMELMCDKSISIIEKNSNKYDLKFEINWVEIFPLLINNNSCVNIIEKSAKENKLDIVFVDDPFSWTEDFSYYTQKFKGAFFGIGSGVNQPQLHNSNYDFPDEIVPVGINIFLQIIREIMIKENKK
jgi:amidohydrolase